MSCRRTLLELNSYEKYPSLKRAGEIRSRMFTLLIKREIRQKSVMHVQSCCFANLNQLLCEVPVAVASGLPHLRELPHLPVVPHLHVNRPLNSLFFVARAEFQVGVDSFQSCFGGKSSPLRICSLSLNPALLCLLAASFAFTKITPDSPIL